MMRRLSSGVASSLVTRRRSSESSGCQTRRNDEQTSEEPPLPLGPSAILLSGGWPASSPRQRCSWLVEMRGILARESALCGLCRPSFRYTSPEALDRPCFSSIFGNPWRRTCSLLSKLPYRNIKYIKGHRLLAWRAISIHSGVSSARPSLRRPHRDPSRSRCQIFGGISPEGDDLSFIPRLFGSSMDESDHGQTSQRS